MPSPTAVAVTTLGVGFAAEENVQPVSGLQIRAKFSGMQLTDEVHWREVYERDGTLRSYSMGMADNCDRRHFACGAIPMEGEQSAPDRRDGRARYTS